MKPVIITYKSVITNKKYKFDITNYISKHPGEGIKNIYLRNFNDTSSYTNQKQTKYAIPSSCISFVHLDVYSILVRNVEY